MNVLFTITYYTPYISGLTIYASRLAESLAKRKYSITVLTTQHDKKIPLIEEVNNVQIKRVPYFIKLHKGFFMPKFFIESWKNINKSSVVISHLPQFEGCITSLFCFLQRKKFYCIYHCDVILPKGFINLIVKFFLDVSHYITLLFAEKIITYTKDYAQHSRTLKFFLHKTVYVYPPIPFTGTENKKLKKELSEKIADNKYVIGVAARFAAEKGFEFLIESIPFLKKQLGDNFIIVFAGPEHPAGEDKYWIRMQPLIKKYKRNIVFVGAISPEEMKTFYKQIDVLVLPSINSTEAFGMVQVEAMFSGVPVVASDLPGVRVPISVTGMGELVEPKNSEDIAYKIALIFKNKKKYMRSRKTLMKTFSFRDTIVFYEELLKSIS